MAETRNSASELVPDDEELVERSLAGDAEAFEVLVKRYGRAVYGGCAGSPPVASDGVEKNAGR